MREVHLVTWAQRVEPGAVVGSSFITTKPISHHQRTSTPTAPTHPSSKQATTFNATMDFLTLANAAHETSRTLLRLLTTDEDDDFAHIENAGPASSEAVTTAQSILENAEGSAPSDINRPLLSPTAEAALLELSTNFLLCESIVIVFYA